MEADLFFVFGLFYATLICLASMSMFWWLEVKHGWEWLADILVILWIGVGMSFIAWMKVWMVNSTVKSIFSFILILLQGNPQFSTCK